MKKLVLILSLAAAACSEEGSPLDATSAADATAPRDAAAIDRGVSTDSGVSNPDADAPDNGFAPDAAELDATPGDTSQPDAADLDAGDPDSGVPDSGSTCGRIGTGCTVAEGCGGGNLECNDIYNVCLPVMPTCGGFAQMMCPSGQPLCLYYAGADYGPCFTLFERNCACATPRGRAALSGCP